MHNACFKYACIMLLLALLVGSASPALASAPAQGSTTVVIQVLAPLVEIFEGDTISLPYFLLEKPTYQRLLLAPLVPSEVQISAVLSSATATATGTSGTITYHAVKAGQETLTLSVSNYFGTATTQIDLKVKARPNYDLSFVMISEDSNDAGGAFKAMFSGEGTFANVPDQRIEGKGTADVWFALWITHEILVCSMNPVIKGHGPFTIGPALNQIPPVVELLPPPGYIPPFMIDLNFEPIALNASTMNCAGMGGITASFPMPATTGDPNEYNLKALTFPGEGGIVEVTGPKTRGYVMVTRMEP